MRSSDYRSIIQTEFNRRKQLNQSYSLRAFARDLQVSSGFLSKLLNGKKELSVEKAVTVSKRLGFNATETKSFCQLVQVNKLKDNANRELLTDSNKNDSVSEPQLLELDLFQVISDWHHYAILELACCHPHALNTKLVAKELRIRPLVAEQALQRLTSLNLLEFKDGQWLKTNKALGTPTDIPSRALRNFHSQMIRKAQESIEAQEVHLRDISGLTIAISENKIDLAKKEILKFRRKMAKLLESDYPSVVYQLNVQFFSLTNQKQNSKKSQNL